MKPQPLLSTFLAIGLTTAAHSATTIQVRVQTLGPVGIAPVIVGFSDGSFDIFDIGAPASAALEDLAETGSPAGFAPPNGGALLGPGVGPGSPPIFGPNGAFASTTFDVDNGNGMLNLAAMILPSNDWFVGNADAIDVSSLLGASAGTMLSFDLTSVYDAGTELEDFDFSPGNGLIGVSNPGGGAPDFGTDQNGVVSLVTGPDPFAAIPNSGPGFNSDAADFTGGPVIRVTLTTIPEPSSSLLFGLGTAALLGARRRAR